MTRRLPFLPILLLATLTSTALADIPPAPPPLELPAPKLLPPGKEYPVTDFGALSDGTTVNTQAIQKAIDTCSANGGGTVVLRGGTFLSGALFLKKGTHLRIDKDAILKATLNPADYPLIDTRFEGIERPFMAAFINAIDLDGISLSGEGTVDGSGDAWSRTFSAFGRGAGGRGRGTTQPSTQPTPPSVAQAPATTGPALRPPPVQTTFTAPRTVLTPTAEPPALTLVGAGSNRPRLVNFTRCTNSAVKDLHLQNQAVWCLHILYCTDFLVDNVDIKDPTRRVPSSDGIDIDSSRRVRVTRTTIDVNDDCISIKSGKDADGRRVNRPCEEILIDNSHMAYGHGGVAMGSEVSGTIRNIEVCDTRIDSDNWAPIRFKSQPTRGGTVENIVYRNIALDNTRQAFEFNLEWNLRGTPGSGARMPTKIKNVYLINITGNVRSGGAIHGLPDAPIENILFQDCTINAATGLRLDNTLNLDTKGLHLTVDQGSPIFERPATPATAPVNANR
jgi:polygalacturonase